MTGELVQGEQDPIQALQDAQAQGSGLGNFFGILHLALSGKQEKFFVCFCLLLLLPVVLPLSLLWSQLISFKNFSLFSQPLGGGKIGGEKQSLRLPMSDEVILNSSESVVVVQ